MENTRSKSSQITFENSLFVTMYLKTATSRGCRVWVVCGGRQREWFHSFDI